MNSKHPKVRALCDFPAEGCGLASSALHAVFACSVLFSVCANVISFEGRTKNASPFVVVSLPDRRFDSKCNLLPRDCRKMSLSISVLQRLARHSGCRRPFMFTFSQIHKIRTGFMAG